MAHFIGKDPNTPTPTGKSPTPSPSPNGREQFVEGSQGTSLAVLQFVAIARGEVVVHVPANAFRTMSIMAERRYCLKCCRVRVHDVWHGFTDEFLGEKIGMDVNVTFIRCRYCEKEGVG